MAIILTGEDGYTLATMMSLKYLEVIKRDLDLSNIQDIWLRPSFGRGAGPKKKAKEKGYSGFGEPDALIIATDSKGFRKIVFIESKKNNVESKGAKRELRYQFFLKLALVSSMLNPTKKIMGESNLEKTYYCVELEDTSNPISKKLYEYYEVYKNSSFKKRANGWMLLKNSPSSPALLEIEKVLKNEKGKVKFGFYALGFTKNKSNCTIITDLFSDISYLPDDINRLFSLQKGASIVFRNIALNDINLKI